MMENPILDALAKDYGWSAEERRHAEENMGNDYGVECQVMLANGRMLCTPAFPEGCGYVRIVHAGYELAYWTSDEWAEDPECVMGAIVGAMKGQK